MSVTMRTISHGKVTHCGFKTNPMNGEMSVVVGIYEFALRDFVGFASRIIAGGVNNWRGGIPKFVEDSLDYLNQRLSGRIGR